MYALITGASSGIGLELAKQIAKDGHDLVLVARNVDTLNQVKEELKQFGCNVLVKPYDLSDINQCHALFDEVKQLDLGLWVNNAGYGNLGLFTDTAEDLELNMINLNIKAVHVLTKLFVKQFEQGIVVNVSSLAAFLPTPTFATYAATKSYVYNLSRAINYEMKREHRNLRVLTVAPGPVKTKFNVRANANINRGMDSAKCAELIYKGIKRHKEFIIPGFSMKLVYFLTKFIPVKWLLKASYRIQTNK
ncbi:MAG: SDR family oxidoreductase [Bacilli bacterium]|nr:SDR family oxidoreductase [Bacilli bacterium]